MNKMVKRVVGMILMAFLIFTLAACGNPAEPGNSEAGTGSTSETDSSNTDALTSVTPGESSKETGSTNQASDSQKEKESEVKSKILIAYFSATGTTKPLAEYAADSLNADIYKIISETPYTSEDLNYNNSSSRANQEQNDSGARPAISGSVTSMEQYDVVFIGYPIWHGQAPRIISTFLESYDFSGKTIVPFCTSHSSGVGSSNSNLHSLCSDSAQWISGERFAAGTSREAIVNWINSLNLGVEAK